MFYFLDEKSGGAIYYVSLLCPAKHKKKNFSNKNKRNFFSGTRKTGQGQQN